MDWIHQRLSLTWKRMCVLSGAGAAVDGTSTTSRVPGLRRPTGTTRRRSPWVRSPSHAAGCFRGCRRCCRARCACRRWQRPMVGVGPADHALSIELRTPGVNRMALVVSRLASTPSSSLLVWLASCWRRGAAAGRRRDAGHRGCPPTFRVVGEGRALAAPAGAG